MKSWREQCKALRSGRMISFCDHDLKLEDGKVYDTYMPYDPAIDQHTFRTNVLSFAEIKRALKSGMFW